MERNKSDTVEINMLNYVSTSCIQNPAQMTFDVDTHSKAERKSSSREKCESLFCTPLENNNPLQIVNDRISYTIYVLTGPCFLYLHALCILRGKNYMADAGERHHGTSHEPHTGTWSLMSTRFGDGLSSILQLCFPTS